MFTIPQKSERDPSVPPPYKTLYLHKHGISKYIISCTQYIGVLPDLSIKCAEIRGIQVMKLLLTGQTHHQDEATVMINMYWQPPNLDIRCQLFRSAQCGYSIVCIYIFGN